MSSNSHEADDLNMSIIHYDWRNSTDSLELVLLDLYICTTRYEKIVFTF